MELKNIYKYIYTRTIIIGYKNLSNLFELLFGIVIKEWPPEAFVFNPLQHKYQHFKSI